MLSIAAFTASLLFVPIQYGYHGATSTYSQTVTGDACPVQSLTPEVDVTAERKDPTFSYSSSTADLTRKSASAGSYRPPGATGPAWHTGGLTQGMFTYKRNIPYIITTVSNGLACLTVQKVEFQIILTPQVWVANDYPPGSCMYNAVHEHEMKHVNVDRTVTDRHLPQIRAALVQFSQGRGYFGPASSDQVKASFDEFTQQLNSVLQDQIDSMSQEDSREQQAVDTIQEYLRINNLCAAQLRGVH